MAKNDGKEIGSCFDKTSKETKIIGERVKAEGSVEL